MRRIGVKGEVMHAPPGNPDNAAGNLIGACEIFLERQLAVTRDENGVHIGSIGKAISHPAQCFAVDELIVTCGGDGPAVVSRDRLTTGVRRASACRQGRKWCQRSSAEKSKQLTPSHSDDGSIKCVGRSLGFHLVSACERAHSALYPTEPAFWLAEFRDSASRFFDLLLWTATRHSKARSAPSAGTRSASCPYRP